MHELGAGMAVGRDVVAARVIEGRRDHRALIRIDGVAFRWCEATLSESRHYMTFYRKTEDRDIFNMPVGNLTLLLSAT